MLNKIIFGFVVLSVVNASVITINVFDDGHETEVANVRSCNPQACDQLCRRLNFSDGTCVNGRCKCDNFLQTKGVILEKSLFDIEDSVSLREDDPESEANVKSCNPQACDQLCRRLQFHGGACVNGRCKCDNFLQTSDGSEIEVPATPKSCSLQACEQLCHSLGFPGGACVNGRCKCDNFRSVKDEIAAMLSNVEDSFSTRRCTLEACNLLCSKLKYQEGVCTSNRCKCINNTSMQEESLADCNSIACDDQCRRNGWDNGACIHGQCKCNYFLNTEDAVDNYSEVAPRSRCWLKQCNRSCARRGYEHGICVNNVCKCYHRTQTETLSDCDSISCDDQCRRNGWDRGTCIHGQCKCNYFLNTEDLSNDVTTDEQKNSNLIVRTDEEELIVPSPRSCNTVNCNQMCHRLHYAGGSCRGGVCQCY